MCIALLKCFSSVVIFHLDNFGSEASIPIPDSKSEDVQDLTSHVCINSNPIFI